MTGNETDARLALARALPVLSHDGSTRTVYLKDNVVYKVETFLEDRGVNAIEYRNMTDSDIVLPTGVHFPAVTLFDIDGTDVIAMEYISGQVVAECYCMETEPCTDMCAEPIVIDLVKGILHDTSGLNVIVNENGIYIIDMG